MSLITRIAAASVVVVSTVAVATAGKAADAVQPTTAGAPSIFDVGFGVAFTNDVRIRGVSYTDKKPAVNGYLEIRAADWLYAGVWGSNVSFPTRDGLSDPSTKINFFGGARHKWGAVGVDTGALYYYYPGERPPNPGQRELDYWELFFNPSYTFENSSSITGNLYWTKSYANTGSNALYLAVVPKIQLGAIADTGWTSYASGEFGKLWLRPSNYNLRPVDYLNWNVGGGVTNGTVTFDVRYVDTDLKKSECIRDQGARRWCGATIVGKISFDTSLSRIK